MYKSVSIALFCVALICYALPWHGAAVGGKTFGGVTGIHLVTGKTATEKGLFGIETKRRVNVEVFAVLSFLAVLGGAAAGFVKDRKGLVRSAAGTLAVALLVMLHWKLGREARGLVESDTRFGFYLTLLLAGGAAGLNLYATMVLRGAGEIADAHAEKKAVCARCGSAIAGDDRFCGNCGRPVA